MPNFTVLNGKVDITDGENYYCLFIRDIKTIRRSIVDRSFKGRLGTIPVVVLEITFYDSRTKPIIISRGKLISDNLDRLYQTIKGKM